MTAPWVVREFRKPSLRPTGRRTAPSTNAGSKLAARRSCCGIWFRASQRLSDSAARPRLRLFGDRDLEGGQPAVLIYHTDIVTSAVSDEWAQPLTTLDWAILRIPPSGTSWNDLVSVDTVPLVEVYRRSARTWPPCMRSLLTSIERNELQKLS